MPIRRQGSFRDASGGPIRLARPEAPAGPGPGHRAFASAGALLAAVALAVLGGGACSERNRGEDLPEVIARVNGAPITMEALARELAFLRRTSTGLLPQAADEQAAFRRTVLQEMIDRMLVLGAAHEAGVAVPSEKVEREILKLKAEYHGSAFDDALAEGRISAHELRERTRARLLVERYFVDAVYSRVAVTDAEVEAYHAAHPDEFAQPEQVRAAQIVVKTAEEARRIQALLRQGMKFDDAARRFSLSPDAKIGGDLGVFARGTMPPVFDQVCFSLAPGRISEVIESEYGFHLFKVVDRRPAEARALDKARREIEKKLVRRKQEEAQKSALAQLRGGAQIVIDEAALDRVAF